MAPKQKKLGLLERITKIWLLAVFEGFGMGLFTFVVTCVIYGATTFGVFTIALSLTLAISIMAPTTGGHINPAVTITLLLAGLFGTERVKRRGDIGVIITQSILYLAFQFTGAILASCFARWFVDADGNLDVFFDALAKYDNNFAKVVLTEIFGTFLLCFTVTCLVYRQAGGDFGPLLVGLTVLASAECLGSYSGGFFNPGLVVGVITSGVFFMTHDEYQAIPDGYDSKTGTLAAEFCAVWLASQFAGAILAWIVNMIVQVAKRRHESVVSAQMDIRGAVPAATDSEEDEIPLPRPSVSRA